MKQFVLAAMCLLLAGTVHADDGDPELNSLAGLGEISVGVSVSPNEEVPLVFSESQLQALVESQLEEAGITVVRDENSPAQYTFLAVSVTYVTVDKIQYAITVKCEFIQLVSLVRNEDALALSATWAAPSSTLILGNDKLFRIKDKVVEMVDRFCKAYWSVNE